jgi:NAD(P)-dependent dehydrogenase (short-subunit alcohol dehydrogenase family)
MSRLDGKVALVTGAASGLGKAISERLAADGARVVLSDIDGSLVEQVADALGGDFLSQDVTDEQRWAAVTHEIQERHGALHIVVNNAGILGPMDAINPEDTRLQDWRRIFAVNVEGVFLGCRAAIPALRRAGGGSIVNISSVAGLLATPYATAYGASKAAVRQLTKSVAQHCAEEGLGIRCNSVHPGNVLTPLWRRQAEELAARRGTTPVEVIEQARTEVPMGDFTTPEDVAGTVGFLASDDARFVTGTMHVVDGGFVNCDTFHVGVKSRAANGS